MNFTEGNKKIPLKGSCTGSIPANRSKFELNIMSNSENKIEFTLRKCIYLSFARLL